MTLGGWTLLRVSGHSMAPLLSDGDFAVARRLPGRQAARRGAIQRGDVVLVDHPSFGLIVKRIRDWSGTGAVLLEGTSAASTPSIDLGAVDVGRLRARLLLRVGKAGLHRLGRRGRPR